MAILVYEQTRDPLATTALFIAAEFVPALLAPAVTARVDGLALRKSLPVIYLAEAVMFVGLAVLAEHFVLELVLLLALLDGALMLTARALTRAAVNATLQPVGMLREGNGLMNVGFATASIGGAALGGLLVNAFGASVALTADALSFALVALALATARQLPAASSQRGETLARLREGLQFARQHAIARVLLFGEAVAVVLFTISVPIEVVYARETLRVDEAGFGLLLSSWGLGGVLGSLVFLVVKHRSTAGRILLSTLAIGVAYLGMAGVDELWLACAFSVLGGVGNGVQWVSVMTALQEVTPDDLQARVTGLLESVGSVMTGVGFLLGGIITSVASPPTAFAVAGGGTVILVAIGALAGITRLRGPSPGLPDDQTLPRPPGHLRPEPTAAEELQG